jgi:hypothetical protein
MLSYRDDQQVSALAAVLEELRGYEIPNHLLDLNE